MFLFLHYFLILLSRFLSLSYCLFQSSLFFFKFCFLPILFSLLLIFLSLSSPPLSYIFTHIHTHTHLYIVDAVYAQKNIKIDQCFNWSSNIHGTVMVTLNKTVLRGPKQNYLQIC